jgi:rhodanese-related sulfurtransferase
MRPVLIPIVAAAVILIGAGPAAPPDYPVEYIKADELKALLDQRARVDIIDVRTWAEYAELHIKGARSMPLKTVSERAPEVPRTGLVVFY